MKPRNKNIMNTKKPFNLSKFQKNAFQDDGKELMQGQTRGFQNCFKLKMEANMNAQKAWESCHKEYSKSFKLAKVASIEATDQIRETLDEVGLEISSFNGNKAVLLNPETGEKLLYEKDDTAYGHVVVIHGKGYKFLHSLQDL